MGRHNSACVVTAQGDFTKQPPHWWRRMGTGADKSIYNSLWVTHSCSVDFCLFPGLHECFYGNLNDATSWRIGPDFRPHTLILLNRIPVIKATLWGRDKNLYSCFRGRSWDSGKWSNLPEATQLERRIRIQVDCSGHCRDSAHIPWPILCTHFSSTFLCLTLSGGLPLDLLAIPLLPGQPATREQPVLEYRRPALCQEAGQSLRCNLCSRVPHETRQKLGAGLTSHLCCTSSLSRLFVLSLLCFISFFLNISPTHKFSSQSLLFNLT